jgi:nitric oxide reductase NorD protein
MGWDESLFSWAYDTTRRVRAWCDRSSRQDGEEPSAQGAMLSDWESRAQLLTSMLAEQPMEVRAAPADPLATVGQTTTGGPSRMAGGVGMDGGWSGNVVWVPSRMVMDASLDLNQQAYRYRLAYAVMSRRMGFVWPGELESHVRDSHARRAAQVLLSLLAIPATQAALVAMYPASEKLAEVLCRAHLQWRLSHEPAGRSARHEALELLLRMRLMGSVHAAWDDSSREQRAQNSMARAFAAQMFGVAPKGPAELAKVAPDCIGRLCELDDDRAHRSPVLWLWGVLLPASSELAQRTLALDDMPHESVERDATERLRNPEHQLARDVEVIERAEDPAEENPLTHSFEKVHTAEEYQGGRKRVDADDDMAEHGDALDELDLREVIRSKKRAKSMYRAELMWSRRAHVEAPDGAWRLQDGGFTYDEWDASTRRYLRDYCRVQVSEPQGATAARVRQAVDKCRREHAGQIRSLRAEFDRIEQARAWRSRQMDGPDVDIDAAVESRATVASGHSPPDRLYMSRRRASRDVAMVVLLDMSLSTDAWVGGHRVMDVVQESVLVLGEALASFEQDVAIGAFYSHTHRDCRYLVVKSLHESWSTAYTRLLGLQPTGYTRMGPAIRHATYLLTTSGRKKKVLLLISDGKPTDYDRYEGRYGMGDVRQALREAEQSSVHPFALAIDAQAKNYLPRLFGDGKYEILPSSSRLKHSLGVVYGRILRHGG